MSQQSAFFRVYNRLMNRFSNQLFAGILATPPIATNPEARQVLYTLLDKKSCRAYLLAAKSFLRYFSDIRVVVQSDGTLDAACAAELRYHLPGIVISSLSDAYQAIERRAPRELLGLLPDLRDRSRCHFFIPLKLLNVIYQLADQDVVFLDSDIIFLREPAFLIDWLTGDKSYSFYSDGGSLLGRRFHNLGFDFHAVDVNDFNSGILGFHNQVDDAELLEIFRTIQKGDAALLTCHEIEQSIWAVLFNSFPHPMNLDDVQKDYVASGYWELDRIQRASVVAHFVGSIRFKNFRYLRLAHEVIRALRSSPLAGVQRVRRSRATCEPIAAVHGLDGFVSSHSR